MLLGFISSVIKTATLPNKRDAEKLKFPPKSLARQQGSGEGVAFAPSDMERNKAIHGIQLALDSVKYGQRQSLSDERF